MGLFPITDLYNVMAYALSLAQSRNLNIFATSERILSQHFLKFVLLELRAVLEKYARRGRTA
jgi:hypothetical protein